MLLDLSHRDIIIPEQVAISPHNLAFSSDSGAIGVIDLSTQVVTMMKQKHTSVRDI